MTAAISYDEVGVGQELPGLDIQLQRMNLIMYAGASGDFNPIHWSESFAKSVGLPDVIAHGMLTMATACRVVTDWVGDPGAVKSYSVRFARPVVVPNGFTGVRVTLAGQVAEKLPGRQVVVEITAHSHPAGAAPEVAEEVLTRARAIVQLD